MAITPVPQKLEDVFSSTNYFIDFYQRQYKWNKEPVDRLLDDIFHKFNQDYAKLDTSLDPEIAAERIGYYFLNTYVTNTIEHKVFLVDGQQRFTTLNLLMIQLFHLGNNLKSELVEWIKAKIYGISGASKNFWLQHLNHLSVMEDLLKGVDYNVIKPGKGVTGKNMIENSKVIKNWLDKEIKDQHNFDTFVYYLLRRVQIVKLDVIQQDVPMVFEVINDRGVRLKPHEILKGKLLGQIDKKELETLKLNELWDEQINKVGVSIGSEYDEIDYFFEAYIRSKIANSRGASEKYTFRNYHRILFEGEVEEYFKLHRNPANIKKFLLNDFVYFTNLYAKIRTLRSYYNTVSPHLYFNYLNDQSGHYILILGACKLNDPEEDEKIKEVAYHFDRLFSLLQLQKAHGSSIINDLVYSITQEIREKPASQISSVFEKYLLKTLSDAKNYTIAEPFSYSYFKDVGYNDLPTRFNRYFFARIEDFILKEVNLPVQLNFENLVRNNGSVNGHHVEHILGHNDENLKLFGNDDETFERERNRLGGLLLLKGNTNQSSGAEPFSDKLKTYAQSFFWNATLCKETYHSNLDLQHFLERSKLNIRSMDTFGPAELEERHKLLFEMIKIIWK